MDKTQTISERRSGSRSAAAGYTARSPMEANEFLGDVDKYRMDQIAPNVSGPNQSNSRCCFALKRY
ncbi:MAG: hypothetical protein ACLTCB_00525 [Merdibacter sp.]